MPVNFVTPVHLSLINSATFTGNYDVACTGLEEACFLLRIINDSNRDVLVSYDGNANHDYLVAGNTLEINAQANSSPNGDVALFRKGQKIYVKAAAGTGYVYIAAYFSRQ